jgi:galactonate dehydratase
MSAVLASASAHVYRFAISPVRTHTIVVLRLVDRDGVVGLGEAAMAYGESADALPPALASLCVRYVLGRAGGAIEAIRQDILRCANWAQDGGPVLGGALAAIDQALHDLKARRLGLSVAALLGGPVRERVETYANGWYGGAVTPDEFAAKARHCVAAGFRALKFDPFRMTAAGQMHWPPPVIDDDLGRLAVARVAAVREAIGPAVKLLVEFHGGMAPMTAVRWGRAIASFHPWFIEEPCPTTSPAPYRVLRRDLGLPVATGERLYHRNHFQPFLAEGLIDVAQPDIGLAGGFSEMRAIALAAEGFGIAIMPHNCAGPILTAASLQFDLATPNALMQEVFPFWADDRYRIVPDPLERRIVDGQLAAPEAPGLGVTLDEDLARHHQVWRLEEERP